MRLWVSQIDVIAQEQQSESGGGVTGTQHAPVESQIETVPSVGAQLAPDRPTEPSWHHRAQLARVARAYGAWVFQGVHGGHCLSAPETGSPIFNALNLKLGLGGRSGVSVSGNRSVQG